jgi:AcrR family transcriptional regulator
MAENKSKDVRRKEILDAAVKCFTEKGLQNTRIDDIAREAHLTKGGVYWHFKDKQEIYLAMIEKHLKEDIEFWKRSIAGAKIGADALIKAGIAYLRYFMRNRGHIYLHAEMIAESFRDKLLKRKLNNIHRKWRTMIAEFFLSILKSMGKETGNTDLEAISCLLLACIEGIAHQYWLSGEDVKFSYYENAWISFTRLLFRGL